MSASGGGVGGDMREIVVWLWLTNWGVAPWAGGGGISKPAPAPNSAAPAALPPLGVETIGGESASGTAWLAAPLLRAPGGEVGAADTVSAPPL